MALKRNLSTVSSIAIAITNLAHQQEETLLWPSRSLCLIGNPSKLVIAITTTPLSASRWHATPPGQPRSPRLRKRAISATMTDVKRRPLYQTISPMTRVETTAYEQLISVHRCCGREQTREETARTVHKAEETTKHVVKLCTGGGPMSLPFSGPAKGTTGAIGEWKCNFPFIKKTLDQKLITLLNYMNNVDNRSNESNPQGTRI